MAVPNTTTFSFQDVKNSVSGSPNDLVSAFGAAIPSAFDPAYSGGKNNLLNFRNYDESGATLYYILLGFSGGAGPTSCGQPQNGFYADDPTWTSAQVIWENNTGTLVPPIGYYSNGTHYRYWNGTSLGFSTLC